jgi:hypothetical protein
MRHRWYVPIGGAIAAAALAAGWVDLPCSIEAPGKVFPRQEWVVVRGPDGQLLCSVSDHLRGRAESYAVVGFERSDYAQFQLHPALSAGAAVTAGDTVGRLYSSDLERELADLRGQLAAELASLAMAQTGDKESVVEEAQRRFDQARVQAEQQRREVARLRALLDRSLVSRADVELGASTLRLNELQQDIAAAQLRTARTGVRQPEVERLRVRVASLQEEVDLLARKAEAATVRTPLSGRFAGPLSGDTLVVVQDTSAYVVLLPIGWERRHQVAAGQPVAVQLAGSAAPLAGTVEQLGRTAYTALDGRQFFNAKARIEDPAGDLAPGLIVRCSITCPPVNLFEYLHRFFAS